MTFKRIKQLKKGDVVKWVDPDNNSCTKYYDIETIKRVGDIIQLISLDGCYLECYKHELFDL